MGDTAAEKLPCLVDLIAILTISIPLLPLLAILPPAPIIPQQTYYQHHHFLELENTLNLHYLALYKLTAFGSSYMMAFTSVKVIGVTLYAIEWKGLSEYTSMIYSLVQQRDVFLHNIIQDYIFHLNKKRLVDEIRNYISLVKETNCLPPVFASRQLTDAGCPCDPTGEDDKPWLYHQSAALTSANKVQVWSIVQTPSVLALTEELSLLPNYKYSNKIKRLQVSDISWITESVPIPPKEMFCLTGLLVLNLVDCGFTALFPEICNLTQLRRLHLNGNRFKSLPSEIGNLTLLRDLFLGDGVSRHTRRYNHDFEDRLPAEMGKLASLEKLWLQKCNITRIPPEIENLSNLVQLLLHENPLATLPLTLTKLTKLKAVTLHLLSTGDDIHNFHFG